MNSKEMLLPLIKRSVTWTEMTLQRLVVRDQGAVSALTPLIAFTFKLFENIFTSYLKMILFHTFITFKLMPLMIIMISSISVCISPTQICLSI
jgi:hypothetical protein